jgi:hypothetical protein
MHAGTTREVVLLRTKGNRKRVGVAGASTEVLLLTTNERGSVLRFPVRRARGETGRGGGDEDGQLLARCTAPTAFSLPRTPAKHKSPQSTCRYGYMPLRFCHKSLGRSPPLALLCSPQRMRVQVLDARK